MGRTSDARARILGSATRLFYHRGYNAVGVKEICEQAGARKGSFHYFFPFTVDTLLRRVRELLDRSDAL